MKKLNEIEENGEESANLGECIEDKRIIAGHKMGMIEVGQVRVDAAETRKAAMENYGEIAK